MSEDGDRQWLRLSLNHQYIRWVPVWRQQRCNAIDHNKRLPQSVTQCSVSGATFALLDGHRPTHMLDGARQTLSLIQTAMVTHVWPVSID